MASIKSSLLLASLASLSLATPVREKQSPRAQLLPYYLGKPHKYPHLQCAATGQWGGVLDEKTCGTRFFCHYTAGADRYYRLGHDQSYDTRDACLKDREPAPDGQAGAERLQEGLVPYLERPIRYSSECGEWDLHIPDKGVVYCGTKQYCEKYVEQSSKTLEQCLEFFEKPPVGSEHPEDPKSDTQLCQGKDYSNLTWSELQREIFSDKST